MSPQAYTFSRPLTFSEWDTLMKPSASRASRAEGSEFGSRMKSVLGVAPEQLRMRSASRIAPWEISTVPDMWSIFRTSQFVMTRTPRASRIGATFSWAPEICGRSLSFL